MKKRNAVIFSRLLLMSEMVSQIMPKTSGTHPVLLVVSFDVEFRKKGDREHEPDKMGPVGEYMFALIP